MFGLQNPAATSDVMKNAIKRARTTHTPITTFHCASDFEKQLNQVDQNQLPAGKTVTPLEQKELNKKVSLCSTPLAPQNRIQHRNFL